MKTVVFNKHLEFGAATSSYQVEGAIAEDGKSESIWDRFCLEEGAILDHTSGSVACDHYHRYKEDVALLRTMGIRHYRFSVSWCRVLPDGTGMPNKKGLEFYHALCDELIRNGIEPMVTLYHWDLPQCLQDKGGFSNPECVSWFCEYARLIFTEFRDKATYFITFNEPHAFVFSGYANGVHAPGQKNLKTALAVAHNVLLCHGAAVALFRELHPTGKIGICCDLTPFIPLHKKDERLAALYENKEFNWFAEAVLTGNYPSDAVDYYRKLRVLPPFSRSDMNVISRPCDFFAVNYYHCERLENAGTQQQPLVRLVQGDADRTDIGWSIDPEGLYRSLRYIDRLKPGIEIVITENGRSCRDIVDSDGEVKDMDRIDYLYRHLLECKRAQDAGINLTRYYVWSLMDNFEWACGYTQRFGLVYVDFKTQKRIIKESGRYYADVIRENDRHWQ